MVTCLASDLRYPPTIRYTKPLRKFLSIVSACVDFCTVFWNRPRPLPRHCRFIILSPLNNICADSEQRCRDPAWTVACRVSLVPKEWPLSVFVEMSVVTQYLHVVFLKAHTHTHTHTAGRPFHSHMNGPHRTAMNCAAQHQHLDVIQQHEYQHSLLYTLCCKTNFSWTLHRLPGPPTLSPR